MTITSLIDNVSRKGLPTEHGLSLYIACDDGRRILFDMGQGQLFADNAERIGQNIAEVDVAVISHGHYDHGGGLHVFLSRNEKAPVYVQRRAFEPHYSLRETGLTSIGLNPDLQSCGRLVFCDERTEVADGITLFAGVEGQCCMPRSNRLLFGPDASENDTFCHEQHLLIREGDKRILLAGCAHLGIVGILRKATLLLGQAPTHVFAGMHLMKSDASASFIAQLAGHLMACRDTHFYTMHCTGVEGFQQLQAIMGAQIAYLSCGDNITI